MRGKAFLKWTSIDLSSKLSLTYGRIVNYYKSAHHPVPTPARGNREHPGNFQNKLVNSPFNWVSRYILLHCMECVQIRSFSGLHFPAFELNTERYEGERRPFLGGARRETTLCDYPQEHLVAIRDENVSPFVKLEIILPFLCLLLDPFTNKYCKT